MWRRWHLSIFGLTINYFKCTTLGSWTFLWLIFTLKISFKKILSQASVRTWSILRIDTDEHDGAKTQTGSYLRYIHVSLIIICCIFKLEFGLSLDSMNEHKIYKISCISARKPDLGGFGPTYQNGNHCMIKSRGTEERNHFYFESHIASYFLTAENNGNASQQCTCM